MKQKEDKQKKWSIESVEEIGDKIKVSIFDNKANFYEGILNFEPLQNDNETKPESELNQKRWNHLLKTMEQAGRYNKISQGEYRRLKRDDPKNVNGYTARIKFKFFKLRDNSQQNSVDKHEHFCVKPSDANSEKTADILIKSGCGKKTQFFHGLDRKIFWKCGEGAESGYKPFLCDICSKWIKNKDGYLEMLK